jgi:hypothetical protein
MARKYKSILPAIRKGAAKLQASQDKVIQNRINSQLFNSKDPRFLTKIGRGKRLELIRQIGNRLALNYTTMIKEKFNELGVSYVPFMLEYTETEKNINLVSGRKIKVPKHNFTLGIDDDFIRSVNSRKISYHTWIIRKDPELGKRYYKEVIKGLSANEKYKSTPQWGVGGRLWKQYQKEVPDAEKEIQQMDHKAAAKPRKGYLNGKFLISSMSSQRHINNTTYKKQPIPPSHHMKPNQIHEAGDRMKVATHEIDKFIENEQYIFGGNLNKFLMSKMSTGDMEMINDILSDVLGQFKVDLEVLSRLFVEKDYKELAKGEETTKKGIAPKFKQDTKTKSGWKVKPKFPNIESILHWFLNDKDGMASSTKLEQYNNLKTIKAKANWIDRSIFLIANGVYAKKLGHKRGLTPTGRQKKYGKAATIKHAQKFKRYSEDRVKNTERTRNLADWRKITSTAARGMKKRKNDPSSRKDNREDNR